MTTFFSQRMKPRLIGALKMALITIVSAAMLIAGYFTLTKVA